MSALLVLDGTGQAISYWTGELPRDGDIIWFEIDGGIHKLLRVTTVVHVVRACVPEPAASLGLSRDGAAVPLTAYPTTVRRIFVEDLDTEGDRSTGLIRHHLERLKVAGL